MNFISGVVDKGTPLDETVRQLAETHEKRLGVKPNQVMVRKDTPHAATVLGMDVVEFRWLTPGTVGVRFEQG